MLGCYWEKCFIKKKKNFFFFTNNAFWMLGCYWEKCLMLIWFLVEFNCVWMSVVIEKNV
jgi:hypothetical protein